MLCAMGSGMCRTPHARDAPARPVGALYSGRGLLHILSQMSLSPWSEALARMMFEQSPFSSVLYDSQGHVIAVNEAFRAMWGVDASTAPPDYSVLDDPELAKQGVLGLIGRAFAGESVVTPAVRYDISKLSTSGTGFVHWTQGHFYPLLDN